MPRSQRIRRLNPVDAGFLLLESNDTPMHIAALDVFSLPADAPDDYLEKLVARFRKPRAIREPYSYKLRPGVSAWIAPAWEIDDDIDLDYHVRHTALPRPGGERELGALISRLHTHRLNRRRPLWECHVIEGLEGGRFAIYTKMHHAVVDGVSGRRMFYSMLADSPGVKDMRPFWEADNDVAGTAGPAQPSPPTASAPSAFRVVRDLLKAAKPLLTRQSLDQRIARPFDAPHSALNVRIQGARRYATQAVSLARVKTIAKAHGATVNDVVLMMCSSALRRYLREAGMLPSQPLIAGCPVSLRPKDSGGTGNAVGYMYANLATDVDDPIRRFEIIRNSSGASRDYLQGMDRHVLVPMSQLIAAPMFLAMFTGTAGRTKPAMNVTISNIPGPATHKYFDGARLEASYPVSIPVHGQAVNVTCVSYAGGLNFGIVGCRDTQPHLQRLAVYIGEALDEFESAVQRQTASIKAAASPQ